MDDIESAVERQAHEALRQASYYRAPESLRARIAGQIAAGSRAQVPAAARGGQGPRVARGARAGGRRWWAGLLPAFPVSGALAGAARAALMAGLALAIGIAFLGRPPLPSRDERLLQQATFDYWRASRSAQALQLASADPAQVSPWIERQARFTAPVRDLSAQGFELRGARLDQLDDRDVAVLAYRRRQHAVDVFVWPVAAGTEGLSSAQRRRDGANVVRWSRGGINFCAVSDLPADELIALRAQLDPPGSA